MAKVHIVLKDGHHERSAKGDAKLTGACTHERQTPAAAAAQADGDEDAAYLAVVRQARTHIASYAHPHNWHGVWSTLLTWALWLASLGVLPRIDLAAWWAPLVLPCWMFVRAGSYVRAFVLFHDFAHFAVFSSKRANVVLGTLTGLLVGTDYFDYRTAHNAHHSDIAIKVRWWRWLAFGDSLAGGLWPQLWWRQQGAVLPAAWRRHQ
jgi:hypothetical protein